MSIEKGTSELERLIQEREALKTWMKQESHPDDAKRLDDLTRRIKELGGE